MSARWSIPAPVWQDNACYIGVICAGRVFPTGQGRLDWEPHTSQFKVQGEVTAFHKCRSDARAWVEAEVMKALGAEVME